MSDVAPDDHISRYIRRIQLGLRFLGHGARAHTTCRWTGLSHNQLVTVRRRSRFNANNRLRGPSPSAYSVFFRSHRCSSQAALFISICRFFGLVRPSISIENGERLCEAYEIYREWEPDSDLEFEQAVLLLDGVSLGVSIGFQSCSGCVGFMLIDNLGDKHTICHHCRRVQRQAKKLPKGSHAHAC